MQDSRNSLIQKIHIAKNQLAMDDESYRVFLNNTVKKTSCRLMNVRELSLVYQALRQKGFRPKAKRFAHKTRSAAEERQLYINKITALLTHLQLPNQYADRIAKQAFGVDMFHWLDVPKLRKLIQMLAVYQQRQEK